MPPIFDLWGMKINNEYESLHQRMPCDKFGSKYSISLDVKNVKSLQMTPDRQMPLNPNGSLELQLR